MTHAELKTVVDDYFTVFPEELPQHALLLEQIAKAEPLNDRSNFHGHIAGDGMVLSPDRTKLLMIHHKFFGIWLQPGGHWDPEDQSPLVCAEREVEEETGLKSFSLTEWLSGKPVVPID